MRISIFLANFIDPSFIKKEDIEYWFEAVKKEEDFNADSPNFIEVEGITNKADLTHDKVKEIYQKAVEAAGNEASALLVFCDSAYHAFAELLENGELVEVDNCPIVPMLVGTDHEKKGKRRYRYWTSIEAELDALFSFLLNKKKVVFSGEYDIVVCYDGGEQYACNYYKALNDDFFERGLLPKPESPAVVSDAWKGHEGKDIVVNKDVVSKIKTAAIGVSKKKKFIFLIGVGDDAHKSILKELLSCPNFSGIVFTSSVTVDKDAEGKARGSEKRVYAVSVRTKEPKSVTRQEDKEPKSFTLQEEMVRLFFKIFLMARRNGETDIDRFIKDTHTFHGKSVDRIDFINDSEMDIPLVVRNILGSKDGYYVEEYPFLSSYRASRLREGVADEIIDALKDTSRKSPVERFSDLIEKPRGNTSSNDKKRLTDYFSYNDVENRSLCIWMSTMWNGELKHSVAESHKAFSVAEKGIRFIAEVIGNDKEVLENPLQIGLGGRDRQDNGTTQIYIEQGKTERWAVSEIWAKGFGKEEFSKSQLVFKCRDGKERSLNDSTSILAFWELFDAYSTTESGYDYLYLFPAVVKGKSRCFCIGALSDRKIPYLMMVDLKVQLNNLMMGYVQRLLANDVQIQATRSAIGAIMSRNGSHNIGSHVLAALSHNIGTMPDDQVLYQYIQHRMDYIATATTERPAWCQSTMFVGEMVKRFLSQRHLLNFICKSEGLRGYEFQSDVAKAKKHGGRIRLHVRKVKISNSGKEDQIEVEKDFIKYPDWYGGGCDSNPIDLEGDVSLAIPGGIVGQHAFFTIVENFIRNVAKHDWSSPPENTSSVKHTKDSEGNDVLGDLDVFIDFEEQNDIVDFTIWTRLSDVFEGKMLRGRANTPVELDLQLLVPDDVKKALEIGRVLKDVELSMTDDGQCSLEGSNTKELYSNSRNSIALGNLGTKQKNVNLKHEHCQDDKGPKGSKLSISISLSGGPQIKTADFEPTASEDVKNEQKHMRVIQLEQLPLHQRQQVELERSFIDDCGRLRRENWGLAEMKISAGYLMKAELAKIGGLDETEYCWKSMLIRPCCISDESWFKGVDGTCYGNLESLPNVWHLGYRFSVPKSKMILLLVDDKPKDLTSELETELRRNGIYLMQISEVDGKKELCFQYVVMDEFTGERLKWMLPFRVIATQCSEEVVADKVPSLFSENDEKLLVREYLERVISESGDNWAKICETIKEDICVCWSKHLIAERRKQENVEEIEFIDSNEKKPRIESKDDKIGTTPLALVVSTVGGGSGAGETLVTDLDIVEYAFNEGIDGALEGFQNTGKDVDQARKFVECLQSLEKFKVQEGGNHESDITSENSVVVNKLVFDKKRELDLIKSCTGDFSCKAIVKRQLCAWLKLYKKLFNVNNDNDINDAIDYLKGESKKILEIEAMIAARKRDRDVFDKDTDSWKEIDDEIIDMNIGLEEARDSCKNPIGVLVDYLVSYCMQVKGLISKYAETIATLPRGFSRKGNEGLGGISQKSGKPSYEFCDGWPSVGIVPFNVAMLDQGEVEDSRTIDTFVLRYWRHQTRRRKADNYLEGLSGTQPYLSTLENLKTLDVSHKCAIATRLIENALLRILIVDERTREFLEKHETLKRVYMNMGIYVANDKKISKELDLIAMGQGDFVKESAYLMTDGFVNLSAKVVDNVRRNYPDAKNTDNARAEARNNARKKFHEQFEVLIIHQGIVDKWLPGASHDKKKVEQFFDSLKQVFRYVVITTGRGTPANIPSSARALPFSTIQTTLFKQYPEKMILTDAIMNMLPVKGV